MRKICRIIPFVIVIVFSSSSFGRDIAVSDFEGGKDGWTTVDNKNKKITLNKGAIHSKEGKSHDTWYWVAPRKFLGNQSAAFGGSLAFDLEQDKTDKQYDQKDIILFGSELELSIDAGDNPGSDRTHYEVELSDQDKWRNETTGRPATAEDIKIVLRNLQALHIRGEFRIGDDSSSLDNVTLRTGSVDSNLIRNGSFEEGPNPGAYSTKSAGSKDIIHWTVSKATIDYIGTYFPSSEGSRHIDINGTPGYGGIKQTIKTIAGTKYLLTFDLAGNPQCPPKIKRVMVSVGDKSEAFSHDADLQWSKNTWEFSASSEETTIEFLSLDSEGNFCGALLDNVYVGRETKTEDIDKAENIDQIRIEDVFVVENQQFLPYPFDHDGSELEAVRAETHAGATTRRLILHGENLKRALRAGEAIKSSSDKISYSFDSNDLEEGERWLIDLRKAIDLELRRAKTAQNPVPGLLDKLQRRRAALQDVENLVLVNASLSPGVTPGSKQIMLQQTRGAWPLLFGNQQASLQFVRHDDNVRTDSVTVFYPGDAAAVDLVFKADIPYQSIEVQLLQRPAAAKEGEQAIEVGKIRARRLDELAANEQPIFRTDPIHIVSSDFPLRKSPYSEDALPLSVTPGDKIGARVADPARAITIPSISIAEIYLDPSELGELWRGALKRVSQCDGDKFDGEPVYALKKSTRVSRIVVGEVAKYVFPSAYAAAELMKSADTPIDFKPSVQLHKGDHAAALLIRDELIVMMGRLQPEFLPLTNNQNGEAAALRQWVVGSGQAASLPMLSRYGVRLEVISVPGDLGKPIEWINEGQLIEYVDSANARSIDPTTVYEKPLSEFIDQRTEIAGKHSIPLDSYDSWLDSRIQDAAKKLYDSLGFAIGAAGDANECSLEQLLVVAGQKSEPAVARIVPRLVEKQITRGPPPSEYWVPDKVARGFVERLHLGGEAVAALDQYAALDNAYKAMAVALVTAGVASGASGLASAIGFSSATSGAIGTAVLIGGDIADAAYFGRNDLQRALDSERFYQYAQGASLVIGDEILSEAEARRESVEMALIGLIAPGVGAGIGINDLRYFRNINKGKALIETKGVGIINNLDTLKDVERRQLAAYLDDTLERTRTQGFDSLDKTEQQAMDSLYQRALFAETQEWAPPGAAGSVSGQIDDGAASINANPLRDMDTELITLDGSDTFKDIIPDSTPLIRDTIKPPRKYTVVDGQLEASDHRLAEEISDVPDLKAPSGSLVGSNKIVDPKGEVIATLDKELGAGSFSAVYADPNNKALVTRVTPIESNPKGVRADQVEDVIFGDAVGRRMLEKAESPDGYFRVTKRDGDPSVVTDDDGRRYLVTREENLDPNDTGITDAAKRFARRKPTESEQITMQLAIRELNQKGIVWTDHKMQNFDIVPDNASPTGYRMVLFDPGGFQLMKGSNPEMMWRNARQWQQVIDKPQSQMSLFRNLAKGYDDVWDTRPYGGRQLHFFTPGANRKRPRYHELNDLEPAQFNTKIEELSRQLGEEIPYNPPVGQ